MWPTRFSGLATFAVVALLCSGSLEAEAARGSARDATRTTMWTQISRRCGAAAARRLPPYPWPIAPVDVQHPVRGYFGDPRTVLTGLDEGAFSFHNGVDISAWPGNHVLPVVSGIVTKVTADRVVVASSFDRRFQYIHIHPWVHVGETVTVSRTVLGSVDPIAHHVHLSEIRGMCVVNPLMPGHLTPYRDTTRPVVRSIMFENVAGTRISPLSLSGRVRVIADAFDPPALPSRFPWGSMPVSPDLVSWKLTTLRGRLLRGAIAADFRLSLPPRRDFCRVYAPGTVQNFAAIAGAFRWDKPGRYLYDLTPSLLNTARLPEGRFRFIVSASDTAGNIGTRSVIIAVRQRALTAVLRPVLDTRCSRV